MSSTWGPASRGPAAARPRWGSRWCRDTWRGGPGATLRDGGGRRSGRNYRPEPEVCPSRCESLATTAGSAGRLPEVLLQPRQPAAGEQNRQSVVQGKSVSGRVELGWCRNSQKQKNKNNTKKIKP